MSPIETIVFSGVRWIAAPLCSAALLVACAEAASDSAQVASASNAGRASTESNNPGDSNDPNAPIDSNDPNDDSGDSNDPNEPAGVGTETKAPRVVGYLPTYRFGDAPQLHLDTLTHLILAFAVPNQQGNADFLDARPNDIQRIVADAHASNVKVLAAIGGGAGGPATSVRLRQGVDSYVDSLLALIQTYDLDGADIDIEGDAIEPDTYEQLVVALSKRLRAFPERKLLTAAVAEYRRENYRALGAADFLNIMSYDQCGSWSERACEHSTMAQAQIDLDYWSRFAQPDAEGNLRTIGADNVVLGVPFYARCWGARCPDRVMNPDGTYPKTTDLSYAAIVTYCANGTFTGCSRSADVLTDGDEVDGYYVSLNGPATIEQKAAKARSYGGIMIWELGQDDRTKPLFAEIAQAIPKGGRGLGD